MSYEGNSSRYDVIYLAGCAVNSINPERERVTAMDLEDVYRTGRFCGISSLIWQAVMPYLSRDEDLSKRWREDDAKALERSVRFDLERERVISFFEETGIWYMPMKGILIKDFYPEPYRREMVDNDILIDTGIFEEVCQWFLEQGYKEDEQANKYVHAAFMKKPVYRFEIHKCLFGENNEKRMRDYYKNVEERLIPDENGRFARRFSDNDFFVYLTAHGCKHREFYGIGIRTLIDYYVFLRKKKDALDPEYIREELEKIGLVSHAEQLWNLGWKLFADPECLAPEDLDEEEQGLLEDFLISGTYGTVERMVSANVKEMESETQAGSGAVKIRYLWKRLFPDAEYMARFRPIFGRYRWLIPAGYVYRIIYGCRYYHRMIRSEIKTLRDM